MLGLSIEIFIGPIVEMHAVILRRTDDYSSTHASAFVKYSSRRESAALECLRFRIEIFIDHIVEKHAV